jgi:hypothetical protein
MTTSNPSQEPLFETGSEEAKLRMLPTPTASDAMSDFDQTAEMRKADDRQVELRHRPWEPEIRADWDELDRVYWTSRREAHQSSRGAIVAVIESYEAQRRAAGLVTLRQEDLAIAYEMLIFSGMILSSTGEQDDAIARLEGILAAIEDDAGSAEA